MKLFRNNNAAFGTVTLSNVTKNSIDVAGSIEWYKDGEWGYAYKLHSATTWTYVSQTAKAVSATIGSLTANKKYDVCLYVKFNGEYQRSSVSEETTLSS